MASSRRKQSFPLTGAGQGGRERGGEEMTRGFQFFFLVIEMNCLKISSVQTTVSVINKTQPGPGTKLGLRKYSLKGSREGGREEVGGGEGFGNSEEGRWT